MALAECSKCNQSTCDHFGTQLVTPCLSFVDNQKPVSYEEAKTAFVVAKVEAAKSKPEDLVPTMKLRFKITAASNKGNIESPVTLQQWWLDRSKPNAAGGYPEGKWIDIPMETE